MRPKLTYYQTNLAKYHDLDEFLTALYFMMDTLGGGPFACFSMLCALAVTEVVLKVSVAFASLTNFVLFPSIFDPVSICTCSCTILMVHIFPSVYFHTVT